MRDDDGAKPWQCDHDYSRQCAEDDDCKEDTGTFLDTCDKDVDPVPWPDKDGRCGQVHNQESHYQPCADDGDAGLATLETKPAAPRCGRC